MAIATDYRIEEIQRATVNGVARLIFKRTAKMAMHSFSQDSTRPLKKLQSVICGKLLSKRNRKNFQCQPLPRALRVDTKGRLRRSSDHAVKVMRAATRSGWIIPASRWKSGLTIMRFGAKEKFLP